MIVFYTLRSKYDTVPNSSLLHNFTTSRRLLGLPSEVAGKGSGRRMHASQRLLCFVTCYAGGVASCIPKSKLHVTTGDTTKAWTDLACS